MFTKPEILLRPSLFVAKLCGVHPYNSGTDALYKTQSVLLITLMWICFPNYSLIYTILTYNNINFIVGACLLALFVLVQFTLVLAPHFKHSHFESFFSHMASAQSTLFDLNIRQTLSPSKTSQVCWILLLFISPIIIIACDVFTLNYYNFVVNYSFYTVMAGFFIKVILIK